LNPPRIFREDKGLRSAAYIDRAGRSGILCI
jgi:hypothetical protein